jgi:carbonic anhydrase/acetyltransferase-like protein (isoleucine patch superfamily)
LIRSFGGKHPRLAKGVFVDDSAQLIGDVELGEDASVWFGAVLRGDVHYIRIGARTNIQDLTVIHVSEKTHPTILDEDVTVGHRAILHGCHVLRGSLIGMGSVVMDGAKVGPESLVAAGALVGPGVEIPPRSLARGVPARVVRALTDAELEHLVYSSRHYVDLKKAYLDERSRTT